MADQDLLLLQLLKIPVALIKWLSKVLAILTYLPNYIILSLVDAIVFSEWANSSLMNYTITWIPRLIALTVGVACFLFQFKLIFDLLDLYEFSWWVIIIGMAFALLGLLVLMRKGYKMMLQKYGVKKLMSPMEHAMVYLNFFTDIIGLILALINICMILNATKILSYDYQPNEERKYLIFISRMIRTTILEYIKLFYIKIFFKLFPWRFIAQKQNVQKQKDNILQLMVLLSLTAFLTNIDIIVIILFGLPCIIHPKRRVFYAALVFTPIRWKVVLRHFTFIVLQILQIIIILVCLPVTFKYAIQLLKKLGDEECLDSMHWEEVGKLVKKALLRVPYLIALASIWTLRYKYKKMKMLQQLERQKKKQQRENQAICFQCFSEQFVDSFVYPLILISILLRPWRLGWLSFILSSEYNLQGDKIIKYFKRVLFQPFWIVFSWVMSLIVGMYEWEFISKSWTDINAKFDESLGVAPSQKEEIKCFDDNRYQNHGKNLFNKFRKDIPHFPLFLLFRITPMSLFAPSVLNIRLTPSLCPVLLQKLLRLYRINILSSSSRFALYQQMYKNAVAAGLLEGEWKKNAFWAYARYTDRWIRVQNILKAILPKKIVQKCIESAENQKSKELSDISNEFWYHRDLTISLMLQTLYIVLQTIIGLFGLIFLLPLTVWRLPTFIILFKFHGRKSFFFKVLFAIYKQMLKDIIYFVPKLIAFLIAPRHYLKYIKLTAFQYGKQGVITFEKIQNNKLDYALHRILGDHVAAIFLANMVIFIWIFRIRVNKLNQRMASKMLEYKNLVVYLFGYPQLPNTDKIIFESVPRQQKYHEFGLVIGETFVQALGDLPYFFLIVLIFITMPWRYHYLAKAFRGMINDPVNRKEFKQIMKKVGKDYLCIFLSIILLLTGIKTKRALILIRKNFRLNFFVGFLKYEYLSELKAEFIDLFLIYRQMIILSIALIFGWTRASETINQLREYYKKVKLLEQTAEANRKLHTNTLKQNKELNALNKMSYNCYLMTCSFLQVDQIAKLKSVSRFNYEMGGRQDLWIVKWQTQFQQKYNENRDTKPFGDKFDELPYEQKCKKAWITQNQKKDKPKQTSYHDIIYRRFKESIEQPNDIKQFLRIRISPSLFDKIFMDFKYNYNDEGYGNPNMLPQSDHQDQEYLRLTGQTRLPRVDHTEIQAEVNWLLFKPLQKVVQFMSRWYTQNSMRKLKQATLLFGVPTFAISNIFFIYLFSNYIFVIDRFIGIRIIFAAYYYCFIAIIAVRCIKLYQIQWVSMHPFDLKQDIINFVRDKIVQPTKIGGQKVATLIKTAYSYIKDKIVRAARFIWSKITAVSRKVSEKVVSAANYTYENVIAPLYIEISNKIRDLGRIIKKIWNFITQSIRKLFEGIGYVFKSGYYAIKSLVLGFNGLYGTILKSLMRFFLKFGLLGNLVFTILGLVLMCLPSIICFFFYRERWFIIVSSIHTMILLVSGYKHLNKKEPIN